MGIGNDEAYCGIAWPPLSSVSLPADRVGYEAGALIDRLVRGSTVRAKPILLPPVGIETRQSTDVFATEDQLVAEVMAHIQRHATEGMDVQDILRELPVTRQTLQRRFKQVVGRSPYQEILRVRIEHVKAMLIQTAESLETIAAASGFNDTVRMKVIFKKVIGVPPGQFRKQHRRRPAEVVRA